MKHWQSTSKIMYVVIFVAFIVIPCISEALTETHWKEDFNSADWQRNWVLIQPGSEITYGTNQSDLTRSLRLIDNQNSSTTFWLGRNIKIPPYATAANISFSAKLEAFGQPYWHGLAFWLTDTVSDPSGWGHPFAAFESNQINPGYLGWGINRCVNWDKYNPVLPLTPSAWYDIKITADLITGSTTFRAWNSNSPSGPPLVEKVYAYDPTCSTKTFSRFQIANGMTDATGAVSEWDNISVSFETPAINAYAYVGSYSSDSVSVVNLNTASVVGSAIPVGHSPYGVAVNPEGTRVYIPNDYDGTVSVIDTATNTVVATINVGPLTSLTGITVNPSGTRAYVARYGWGVPSNYVSVIDTASNAVIGEISVGANPIGVAISPDGTRLYVVNYGESTLSVVDTTTNQEVTKINVQYMPVGVAVNPSGTRVYVANMGNASVSVIDTSTNTIIETISGMGTGGYGYGPVGVAVSPDGVRLYVSTFFYNKVFVIDTATNTQLASISVASGPYGISLNASGSRLFVVNYSSGNMSIIDTATNNIVGQPIPVGANPLALGNFVVEMGIPNQPPILNSIGAKTVDEGQVLEFMITASDPDGDLLTYSASDLPLGAVFNPVNRIFTWTPGYAQAGAYNVLFRVTDNGAPPMSTSETISVVVGNVNRPPVLDPIGAKLVNENSILEFAVTASDPDDDTIAFTASNLPTGATFDTGTHRFSWVPDYTQAGNYSVLFKVTDTGTPPASKEETVTITVGNVNRPPVLDPIGNRAIPEGQALTFVVTGSDPDGDALAYSTGELPAGALFDPITQVFTWIPTYNQAGNHAVRFTITDSGTPQENDTEEINISVGNVNRPPLLGTIGSKTISEGQTLTFIVTGTDPDGDALTYSANNLPPGATFDSVSQTYTWTPTYDQAGRYQNIEFTVTDNGSPNELDVELVEITVGNTNRAPAFTPVGTQYTQENQLLQFVVSAADPDGDALTYSFDSLPTGATFNAVTRSFSWTPNNTQAGNYTITFYATDSGGLVGQLQVAITVGDVPTPYEIANLIIQTVVGLNLSKAVENSYMANLKKVCKFVQDGKITPAINQLEAFIGKVRTDIAHGNIGGLDGNNLITLATVLINMLRS